MSELDEVIKNIKNQNSVRKGNDGKYIFPRLKSGILALDIALAGGLTLSNAHLIYGEKSSGKTTLYTMFIKQAQRMFPDKKAFIMDIEGTYNTKYAQKLGVDLERLYINTPESGEEAVDIFDGVCRADDVSIVVVDSLAMLTPTKEIEKSAVDSIVAEQARLIGRMYRKAVNALTTERLRGHLPCVIHINQFRTKVGVMFGDPRTLPGGRAPEYCTSHNILMKNKEHMVDKGEYAGFVDYNEHSFHITKDKTGGRVKEGAFKLIRDKDITGLPECYIDQTKTIITQGCMAGLVEKAGAFIKFNDMKFQGVDKVTEYFIEHPEVQEALQDSIVDYYVKKWDV